MKKKFWDMEIIGNRWKIQFLLYYGTVYLATLELLCKINIYITFYSFEVCIVPADILDVTQRPRIDFDKRF